MNPTSITIFDSTLGTWLLCFTHPFTLRKVRKSFKSRSLANEFKEKTIKQFSKERVKIFQNLTIEEALILFTHEKPKNVFTKKNTHLIDFYETFKNLKVLDLTSDCLKVWLDQIQKENKVKDLTMRKVKCELDILFSYLVGKEIISVSPLKEVYYAKYTPSVKARNILTSEETTELLQEIKKHSPGYLYPIVKLFTETAAKTSEIVDLTWQDLDLDGQLVRFKKQTKIQARTLELSNELVKSLKLLKSNSKTERVFQTYYKESFTTVKIIRAINEFKSKSNFDKNWNPMDLRHSFAVNFLKDGKPIRELQKILGHNNVYDTKKLYGELLENQ